MDEESARKTEINAPVHQIIQIGEHQGPLNVTGELPPPLWARFIAGCSDSAYYWLIRKKVLPAPPGLAMEHRYLVWFAEELTSRNLGDLVYIPLLGLPIRPTHGAEHEYAPARPRHQRQEIRRIRQWLWLLRGDAQGGDQATAQLAAANKASRLVRDVGRFLEETTSPVVLLGDPGSGKSTTLREVGIRLAIRGQQRAQGVIPIYIPLGSYRQAFDASDRADILDLAVRCIPETHSGLRAAMPRLIDEGRLLLLFDGMDEMERTVYAQRAEKLSLFARAHAGRIKCLFACRTNDFLPSFHHRQMVLLPFTFGQVLEYISANFKLPISIDGVPYQARQLARRLLDSTELGDAATNPLTLYLIRHFLDEKGAWPQTRSDLFETYLDSVLHRLTEYETKAGAVPPLDTIVPDLAALGFQIARDRGGVFVEVARLRELWGEERTGHILDWGLRSGLLTVEFAARPEPREAAESPARVASDALAPDDAVGFFHHRLHEFFCAKHLAAHTEAEGALEWGSLLDSPRWQETLLHLVALRGLDVGAMKVLEVTLEEVEQAYLEIDRRRAALEDEIKAANEQLSSIKPIRPGSQYGPPEYSAGDEAWRKELGTRIDKRRESIKALQWEVPSKQERLMADRVVLTAQLLSEPRAGTSESAQAWGEKLRRAVQRLAGAGRPTSQVKMLWAWKHASQLIPMENLTRPRRSEIGWVREQAIQVFGALAAGRKLGAVDFADEVFFDLAAGTLPARFRAYYKAAEDFWRRRALLFWALACHFIGAVLMVASAITIAWLTARALPDSPWEGIPVLERLHAQNLFWALSLLPAALAVMVTTFQVGRLTRWYLLLTGWLCTISFVSVLLLDRSFQVWERTISIHDAFIWRVLATLAPTLFMSAVLVLSFWITFLLATLPRVVRSGTSSLAMALRSAPERNETTGEIAPWGLAAIGSGLWAFFTALGWAARGVAWVIGTVAAAIYRMWSPFLTQLIAALATVLLVLVALRARRKLPEYFAAGLAVLLILLVAGVLLGSLFGLAILGGQLVEWLVGGWGNRLSGWLASLWNRSWPIALSCVLGVVLILLMYEWSSRLYWRLRFTLSQLIDRGGSLPRVPSSPEVWLAQFKTANPYLQAFMLSRATRHYFGFASDGDFLDWLETCESHLASDPAQQIYWKLRHEVEESLKHDRSGAVRPAATQGSKPAETTGPK